MIQMWALMMHPIFHSSLDLYKAPTVATLERNYLSNEVLRRFHRWPNKNWTHRNVRRKWAAVSSIFSSTANCGQALSVLLNCKQERLAAYSHLEHRCVTANYPVYWLIPHLWFVLLFDHCNLFLGNRIIWKMSKKRRWRANKMWKWRYSLPSLCGTPSRSRKYLKPSNVYFFATFVGSTTFFLLFDIFWSSTVQCECTSRRSGGSRPMQQ